MRRSAALSLMLTPLALAGCAQSDAKEGPVPPAQVVGKPQSCIPLTSIDTTRIRDDSTIDFIGIGKQTWRVTLSQPCPELKSENKFGYETSLSQLCSTDVIFVLHDFGGVPQRGASCGLSPFVPVTLAKK